LDVNVIHFLFIAMMLCTRNARTKSELNMLFCHNHLRSAFQ